MFSVFGFNMHVLAQANNKRYIIFNKIGKPVITDKFPVRQQGLNCGDLRMIKAPALICLR